MNHRQFRSVLCYRLAIPMFSEGSICPSCNVHRMDQWGDHAVHCSSEVGVKFRHNLHRQVWELIEYAGNDEIVSHCMTKWFKDLWALNLN
ncbi:hypothetical protein CTI12_AA572020 [Artemisia annua]|uniref:Uncharacterized protein n=1 Tax=Artemisia annua TaxID=35608 RepID=A0A2U1KRV6_ARTAN|nr:hypothetical protein CTI12_AA572020 [Artemisia annua]